MTSLPSEHHAPDGAVVDADITTPLRLLPQTRSVAPRLTVWGAGGGTPYTFDSMRQGIAERLLETEPIHRGKWQTLDVTDSMLHATRELRNVSLFYTVPDRQIDLAKEVQPDLPWADEHHAERVGREPLNPAPSFLRWPHHGGSSARHLDSTERFSHTYPERFWPTRAGYAAATGTTNRGLWYEYGDLDGVVGQLVENPLTRQAVLPVWFPEDTGATDRRVPCSLAYHFMADGDGRLSVYYSLRACDFVRHFHNDVYFACRLLQWVVMQVNGRHEDKWLFTTGELNMTISSLHAFMGDEDRLLRIAEGS
jgi:hypothetical protein